MALVKPNLQKEINADLKRRGGLGFTELEFRNHPDAQKLQAIKEGTYVSTLNDPIEKAFEYNSFLDTVAKQRSKKSIKTLSESIIKAVTTSSEKERKKLISEINAIIKTLGLRVDKIKEIIKECKAQPLPISEEFEASLINKLNDAKDDDAIQIKYLTAQALGLKDQSLIDKIACDEYLYVGMTNSCHECGHTIHIGDIQAKIDSWVLYCSRVDKAISAMNEFPKTWDKMKKKQKNEYLNPLKLIARATNDPTLNTILDFVENYGRNQGVRAQANALLALNLPNITTFEIAKEVTICTTLNKPQ